MKAGRFSIVAGIFFATAGVTLSVGCMSSTKAPASGDTLNMVRKQYMRTDPNAIVAPVIAVEKRGLPFAAIGDVPVTDFKVGDVVTFIDTARTPLTSGIVRHTTDDTLHVEWMNPPKASRVPRVGDLIVRFKQPSDMNSNSNQKMGGSMNSSVNSTMSPPGNSPTNSMASEPMSAPMSSSVGMPTPATMPARSAMPTPASMPASSH